MSKMSKIRLVLLCFLIALCSSAAVPVCAQNGFAVQVAAVQTRAEAEAMANSLRARGLSTYWVKADVPGKGTYYRVRIGGQFADNRSATVFGQKLQTAGVIRTYAVFKFDAPTSALDEHAADQTAQRANAKTNEPPAHKSAPVAVQADKAQAVPFKVVNNADNRPVASASNQPPRTDYLISGSPIPASELETARNKEVALTSQQASASAPTQPNAIAAISNPNVKPNLAKAKRTDEIELDDFVEFAKVLRGTVEAQSGRLQVTLQNINRRHRFRGKVSVTFAENGRETRQAPMQIEIEPEQEQSFEVAPTVGRGGNYVLTVHDEQGALQLMQSGALDSPTKQNLVAENRQPKPQPPPSPTGPGRDVPPLPPLEVTGGGLPPGSNDQPPNSYISNPAEEGKPEQQDEPSMPGDVKIIPRKVMETGENITLEFEILSRQPLGMITLAMRTATLNEAKQGIMTTKQGRIPFLVPAADTNGAFSYELKNEQGALLAAGQMTFQQLKRVE